MTITFYVYWWPKAFIPFHETENNLWLKKPFGNIIRQFEDAYLFLNSRNNEHIHTCINHGYLKHPGDSTRAGDPQAMEAHRDLRVSDVTSEVRDRDHPQLLTHPVVVGAPRRVMLREILWNDDDGDDDVRHATLIPMTIMMWGMMKRGK